MIKKIKFFRFLLIVFIVQEGGDNKDRDLDFFIHLLQLLNAF